MKIVKINYGFVFRPYCWIFGHKLNQPLKLRKSKKYIVFYNTNIVYCTRCDLFIGKVK